jgi:hypothetical protein
MHTRLDAPGAIPFLLRAGVAVWRRFHPDHTAQYASMQAVEVILKATVKLKVEA